IRTRRVVVATGMPTMLVKGLIRHFWFKSSYLVLTNPIPLKIRRQLGKGTAAPDSLGRRGSAARDRRRQRRRAAAPARQGPRAAHRPADVRALDALSR